MAASKKNVLKQFVGPKFFRNFAGDIHNSIMTEPQRRYIAIDLKSFYASVECVDRGLDPLTTNLVVADKSRTDKTICLAVSPSLKAYGIAGRARLFEVVQRVRQVNHERSSRVGWRLTGKSTDDVALHAHPDWAVDYIVAPPRMLHYMTVSRRVYEVYLKYVAPDDIHVYSIDEVFIDVTAYLKTYRLDAHQLAMRMIRDVLATTGITATAGIGTNMYLAKVAMDIVAKHKEADSDGVRIGELDEMSYRMTLWNHRPLTDFWRVGRGIARRLAMYGIDTMGGIARLSVDNEELLYSLFGVNAELLIDHAWGWEPCTIAQIKAYRPETNSLSSGQVLAEPYTWQKARVVVNEMVEALSLKLVEKKLVTNQLVLYVGYDHESLTRPEIAKLLGGPVVTDHYGREVPKPTHGTVNLGRHTSSTQLMTDTLLSEFDNMVDKNLLIRRLNISANNVVPECDIKNMEPDGKQLDLFVDYDELKRRQEAEQAALDKERRMQEAQIKIKRRFGKNAILKGINFEEGATARERNNQVGGHKAT